MQWTTLLKTKSPNSMTIWTHHKPHNTTWTFFLLQNTPLMVYLHIKVIKMTRPSRTRCDWLWRHRCTDGCKQCWIIPLQATTARYFAGHLIMAEVKKMPYRCCFVPRCTNTTVTTRHKSFITMPRDKKVRKMWWTAARRADSMGTKTNYFCCEDHFDVSINM